MKFHSFLCKNCKYYLLKELKYQNYLIKIVKFKGLNLFLIPQIPKPLNLNY